VYVLGVKYGKAPATAPASSGKSTGKGGGKGGGTLAGTGLAAGIPTLALLLIVSGLALHRRRVRA
jgi:hypothetical protein